MTPFDIHFILMFVLSYNPLCLLDDLNLVTMSAPHIPNLNTFRRGGARGRGRGRRFPGDPSTQEHESEAAQKDRIIRNTDNDAATSRLSAVEAGYLGDDFAALLSQGSPVQRRLPLMNRGLSIPYILSHLPTNHVQEHMSAPAPSTAWSQTS